MFAKLLADNFIAPKVIDEETAYRLRSIVADVAYRLFLKSTEDAEAKTELERLVIHAKTHYGISITELIRERLDWAKWWEARFGGANAN